jgi:hypothetical protein
MGFLLFMTMPNANYVCTMCSQTFTRKWRGNVHNLNIHGGISQIVRMVDYIIGRVNGKYLSSDPALFRRRRGIKNGFGPSAAIFNSRDKSYERAIAEGRSVLNKNNLGENYYRLSDSGSSSLDSVQQFNDSSDVDYAEMSREAIIKLAELKELTSKCLSPQVVQNILSTTRMFCVGKGNNEPIDMALEMFRPAAEVKKAHDYLNSR